MIEFMKEISKKTCIPCEQGTLPMTEEQILAELKSIPNWQVDLKAVPFIFRVFEFKNYYQTIAFVNAVAWISHRENHHPDLEVSYNQCLVKYYTHAIQGLSINDFICAAKVEILYSEWDERFNH